MWDRTNKQAHREWSESTLLEKEITCMERGMVKNKFCCCVGIGGIIVKSLSLINRYILYLICVLVTKWIYRDLKCMNTYIQSLCVQLYLVAKTAWASLVFITCKQFKLVYGAKYSLLLITFFRRQLCFMQGHLPIWKSVNAFNRSSSNSRHTAGQRASGGRGQLFGWQNWNQHRTCAVTVNRNEFSLTIMSQIFIFGILTKSKEL